MRSKNHSVLAIGRFTRLLNKYNCCEHDAERFFAIVDTILSREIPPKEFAEMLHGAVHAMTEPEEEAADVASRIIRKAKRNLKR